MSGTSSDPGIMVHTLNDLFLESKKNVNKKYDITLSYLEIYNEYIKDLLVHNNNNEYLELREDKEAVHFLCFVPCVCISLA